MRTVCSLEGSESSDSKGNFLPVSLALFSFPIVSLCLCPPSLSVSLSPSFGGGPRAWGRAFSERERECILLVYYVAAPGLAPGPAGKNIPI